MGGHYNTGDAGRRSRPRHLMVRDMVLLLHGNGWDDLLLMIGAVAAAFVIVKLTMRGGEDDDDSPTSEAN